MKDYRTTSSIKYEEPNTVSFMSIEQLPFLKGSQWNQKALNYIHSLRPSYIRVTTGLVTMDYRMWRVTVLVNDDDKIQSITQEIEVGCIGFKDADDMDKYQN